MVVRNTVCPACRNGWVGADGICDGCLKNHNDNSSVKEDDE